jgi:hypothetical protein
MSQGEGGGRPQTYIDEKELEKLAMMQCTTEEIAEFFQVSKDTIERRFAAILKKGYATGRMSMKRQLFKKVQDGELGAIVWWGKNYAGMSDKVEQKVHAVQETTFKIGWADEHDQLSPPEKDATPIADTELKQEVQESSVGKAVGEDN